MTTRQRIKTSMRGCSGHRRWLLIPGLLLLCVLTGCQVAAPQPSEKPPVQLELVPITGGDQATVAPKSLDPRSANAAVYAYLDIYQLSVPYGAISGNEQFWKRISEQSVDIMTYDLLYKNGIRVGEASLSDWDYFKPIINQYPTTSRTSTLTNTPGKAMEIEIKKDIPGQTLFYFNNYDMLQGRTYDQSDNLLAVSYEPAPRRFGAVRVTLCPVIRATRKRLEFTVRNDEREIQYVTPERLFDLNLTADVPPGHFLVVAPSPQALDATSVGRAFLTLDGKTERLEEVFLVIPRAFTAKVQPATAPGDKK